MVEPGIEPGTSWLVVRNSDHHATRLVTTDEFTELKLLPSRNKEMSHFKIIQLYVVTVLKMKMQQGC